MSALTELASETDPNENRTKTGIMSIPVSKLLKVSSNEFLCTKVEFFAGNLWYKRMIFFIALKSLSVFYSPKG